MYRALRGFVLGALIGSVLAAFPYLVSPGVRIDFNHDSPFRPRYARGFYPPEQTSDRLTYAWTSGRGVVQLRSVPRRTAWRFEARVAAPRPDAGESEIVQLADRREIAAWRLARGTFHELRAIVPPAAPADGLQIELRVSDVFVPASGDSRELGLMVDRIVLVPENRFRALPLSALGRVGASLGIITALAALVGGTRLACGVAILAGLAQSALAFHHSALYLDFDRTAAASLAPAAAVFACGLALRRVLGLPAARWTGAAVAIGAAAVFVKLLTVLHPALTIGDSVFHLNRLQLVLGGTRLFTSNAPGGEFPYPVAFYVMLSKLPATGVDWIPLMRGLVVTIEGITALFVGLTVAGARGATAGFFTVAVWHSLPALFQVHGVAYLTNAFGNLAAAAALAALVAAKPGRSVVATLVGGVFAAVGFLSHVSSLAILGASLLLAGLAAFRSRRLVLAGAAVAICVAAGAAAWVTYYRHFVPVYAELANRRPTSPLPSAVPVQRDEAHQTVWAPGWLPMRNRIAAVPGYLAKYFGWPAIVLSAVGLFDVLRRSRAGRDELDVVLLGWIAAAGAFLAVSLVSSLDLRYYLAAAPAVAALCGCTIARWITPGEPRKRTAALVLFALVAAQGVWYVVRFFGPVLPR